MIILDGKKLSQKILKELGRKIKKHGLKLKLAIVLVGGDPASEIFVRQKEIACKKIGIKFELFKFLASISISQLKKELENIFQDPKNHGVVIQLPLPGKLRVWDEEIVGLIPPQKDVDVLSEKNLAGFYGGVSPILPPVVGAIFHLLKEYKIPVKGENVVLFGAGRLVGFPLAVWLLKEKATVAVVNEFTEDVSALTKKADIIISGVGKPNLIKGSILKKGVVIIDAGTSFKNKKLVGDVDFKSASQKAGYITPVPGGVGPMTVACLLENLVKIKTD